MLLAAIADPIVAVTDVVDVANEQLVAVPLTVQGEESVNPVLKLMVRVLLAMEVLVNILMLS